MEAVFGLGVILVFALVWLTPLVLLILSKRTSGFRKFLWILAFLFVSWFAWLAYILLVPKYDPRLEHLTFR